MESVSTDLEVEHHRKPAYISKFFLSAMKAEIQENGHVRDVLTCSNLFALRLAVAFSFSVNGLPPNETVLPFPISSKLLFPDEVFEVICPKLLVALCPLSETMNPDPPKSMKLSVTFGL